MVAMNSTGPTWSNGHRHLVWVRFRFPETDVLSQLDPWGKDPGGLSVGNRLWVLAQNHECLKKKLKFAF